MNPGFRPLPDLDRCEPPALCTRALQPARAWIAAAFAPPFAALALAVAVQLPAPAGSEPATMSGLRIEGLAGYPVHDVSGVRIGEIRQVETDRHGRTRYINMQLSDGREARLAAFRARLDPAEERIDLVMPLYAVEQAVAAPAVMAAARPLATSISLTR